MEPSRVFTIELCLRKYVNVDYFRKKTPSWMSDWVLNTPMSLDGYNLRHIL